MPESDSQMVLILLSTVIGLLALVLALVFGIRRRLGRIERRISEMGGRRDEAGASPSAAETSTGGAFEMYLSEDPGRMSLPKSEQFAEYRKWRQEKGLNWSNP